MPAAPIASTSPPPAPRPVEVLVLSDLHLGTSHCQAEALDDYLGTIQPARIVLNGDILDVREMQPGGWSAAQGRVVARLLRLAAGGIPVHYITGNHDALLRSCSPASLGPVQLCDELELACGGRRTLVVHGDGLEHGVAMHWTLRKLGCWAYYSARRIDLLSQRLGWRWVRLVRGLQGQPRVARHITAYEEACARHARDRGFEVVITGHIHCARSRTLALDGGTVQYLNSGDWVHSLSALEFTTAGGWQVMRWSPRARTRAEAGGPDATGASAPAPGAEDGKPPTTASEATPCPPLATIPPPP